MGPVEILIRICDVLACITIIASLSLVTKHYRWWLLYMLSNIFYSVVTIHAQLWGLTTLGIVLIFVGLKNYIEGSRKHA